MSVNVTRDDMYAEEYYDMGLSAGVVVGSTLTGCLIALGITCLLLLSSENRGSPKQRFLLRTYIAILLPFVIGLQITYFVFANSLGFFRPHSEAELDEDLFIKLRFAADLLPVIIGGMTDGLFIWRCYMVQQSMRQGSIRWQHIFWVLPAFFWVLGLATGVASTVFDGADLSTLPLVSGIQPWVFLSNAIINLYTMVFISLRLLLHQRTVVTGLGARTLPTRYTHVVHVLLQSAAINVPIAITTAVAIWLEIPVLDLAMFPVAGASQALASVLIIHQVALGRIGGSQNEQPVKLVGSGTSSQSEIEKSEPVV